MSTIAAITTAAGRSALAVIRLSGERAKEIGKQVFKPFPASPNLIKHGKIDCGGYYDDAMLAYFDAPHSFTGEDTVEIYCHGGVGVPYAILQTLLLRGAVLAQKGEFSKRAFINGKLDMAETEGIIDVIEAQSAAQIKAGIMLKDSVLSKKIQSFQEELKSLLAEMEAMLDYPEEDLEIEGLPAIERRTGEIRDKVEKLFLTSKSGKMIKYGAKVVLFGRVNAGKSSLLNALLSEERAIVSDEEGTTRDVITQEVNYKDARIIFTDTAGIRQAEGKVEKLGVERSYKAAEQADVVLNVSDCEDFLAVNSSAPVIRVRAKSDLMKKGENTAADIAVSAKNMKNIEELKEEIYKKLDIENALSGAVVTNDRHINVLARAKEELAAAEESCKISTADIVAENLRCAWKTLGEISGKTASSDIIEEVYKRFCLGK